MIEGVESKCQSASVVVRGNPTALGELAGIALGRNEMNLASCRTDHLLGFDGLVVPGAVLQKNRLGSPEYIGAIADRTQPLARYCNMT